jgi:hypothetical protein
MFISLEAIAHRSTSRFERKENENFQNFAILYAAINTTKLFEILFFLNLL